MKITSHLEEISIFERAADRFRLENPRIRIIHGQVSSIDTIKKIVHIQSKGKTPVLSFDPNYLGNPRYRLKS
jgi:hypothetical protein